MPAHLQFFSPSSREAYSFCPRKWWLSRRYTTKRVAYPELCAMGGSVVSDAMNMWNRARIAVTPITCDELIAIGLQSLTSKQAEMSYYGRIVEGLKDRDFLDELPRWVTTAIQTVWEANPLQHHTILAAEQEFLEGGGARPDVVSRDASGELVVDDYKCKFSLLDEQWLDKEFERYWRGEQRLAYTHLTNCSLFGIILIILQPHKNKKVGKPRVERRTSRVQEHELRLWRHDATMDVVMMNQVLEQTDPWYVPGKTAPHGDHFGPCPFEKACVEYGLQPHLMELDYVPVERGA